MRYSAVVQAVTMPVHVVLVLNWCLEQSNKLKHTLGLIIFSLIVESVIITCRNV